jgi:hypothetical protein
MNEWMHETLRILQLVLRQPDSVPLVVSAIVVVSLVFLVLLRIVSVAFRILTISWLQRFAAAVLALAIPLAGAVAASLYVCPRMTTETLKMAALIAGPVVALLLVAVPLAALIMQARFLQTLCTIVLCLAGAWGALLLSNATIKAVKEGSHQAGKAVEHRTDIDRLLKKP